MRAALLCLFAAFAAPTPAPKNPNPLLAALAEAERFPQDYGAQTRAAWALERVAYTKQAVAKPTMAKQALEAWRRAGAVSNQNLPSTLGQGRMLIALGQRDEAEALIDDALVRFPGEAHVHLLRAEYHRTAPGVFLPGLSNLFAIHATEAALALAPDDPFAHCADGWARLRLGDRAGARGAFRGATDACAYKGAEASVPHSQFSVGAFVSALSYKDSEDRGDGLGFMVALSARFYDLVDVNLDLRRTEVEDPTSTRRGAQDLEITTSDPVNQTEVWLRLGVSAAGAGVRGLFARLNDADDNAITGGDQNGYLYGVSGWYTWWATLSADATLGRYTDGDAGSLSARLYLPVLRWLHLEVGVEATALRQKPAKRDPDATTGTNEDGDVLLSTLLAVHVPVGRLTLSGGTRLGESIRPVRPNEPTAWNLGERIDSGVFARGALRLSDHVSIYTAYETLKLVDPYAGSPDLESQDTRVHVVTGGLTYTFSTTP